MKNAPTRSATGSISRPDVVIVGAGLAGLSCGVHLHQSGLRCLILEASDGIGGRVRTDIVDGFRLDRGFQVLLTAYPEARALLDIPALQPRAFRAGALIRVGGRFHLLGDPLRQPSEAFRTLVSPLGSFRDKLAVARLRHRSTRGSLQKQMQGPDLPTLEFLEQSGVGQALIERFFRPFLGGIFLERNLQTSSRMFRFVFRMFATGEAIVPECGMEEIPRQLAARLPEACIRLQAPVDAIEKGRIVLEGGEVIECERVVVATDGETAARLVDGVRSPRWCEVTCVYYAADRAPIPDPILILNGDGTGPINNLCFPTQVSGAYGPDGRTLVSASVVDDDATRDDIVEAVQAQLIDWFGQQAADWTHLRTYRIRRALPQQCPGWLEPPERDVRCGPSVYVAGDHLDTASSNGALCAGRRAAQAVVNDLAPATAGAIGR